MSEGIELPGVVAASCRGVFGVDVELQGQKRRVTARLSGSMCRHHIRVIVGDRVTVELSPYDLQRARIIFRHIVGERVIDDGRRHKS